MSVSDELLEVVLRHLFDPWSSDDIVERCLLALEGGPDEVHVLSDALLQDFQTLGENGYPTTKTPWASRLGIDEFGIWSEFTFKLVTQRMRWIPPQFFLMGSPASETGRDEDEVQHEVEIPYGYWLADTACTQALWKAVMGKNPSANRRRRGLPVEHVSWNDCQEFLKRINGKVPGLALRLPTETEWECACRAGTNTPFSFGENITTDQVNYDGRYPYAGSPVGEFRGHTVPVKSLPPNPWGLYEMHGNVWEWCMDEYGPYQIGPPRPRDRVFRGGSWGGGARGSRSAYRDGNEPGSLFVDLGFRVAQIPDQAQEAVQGSRRVFRGGSWINGSWFCCSAYRISKPSSGRSRYLGFRLAQHLQMGEGA